MNQGLTNDRYHLVPRVLIFLTRGEEVLLLRGASTKRLWANLYNGVGGHVERGEDILHAAARELAEETGLQPTQLAPPSLWLCGVLSVDTGEPTGIGVFIFRGVLPQPHPSPAPDHPSPTDKNGYAQLTPSSEGSLEWIHPSRLPDLPCLPDLPSLLPRCLAHAPSDPPFFALSTPGADGIPIITFS